MNIIMQLTPLQLEIQQWSDKTLSFGCVINTHHKRKPRTWSNKQYTQDIYVSRSTKSYFYYSCPIDWPYIGKPRYKSDTIEVIWHLMGYWRLCYLFEQRQHYVDMSWEDARANVSNYFQDNFLVYQQTVLERPVELQELVLKFLLTLPKCN